MVILLIKYIVIKLGISPSQVAIILSRFKKAKAKQLVECKVFNRSKQRTVKPLS